MSFTTMEASFILSDIIEPTVAAQARAFMTEER